MKKWWRFDGNVVCDVSVWVVADTQAEAEARFAGASGEQLIQGTSIKHIHPRKDTAVIETIRESTADNP